MDDPELQALRAKRLQELQMQYGGKSTSDNSQSVSFEFKNVVIMDLFLFSYLESSPATSTSFARIKRKRRRISKLNLITDSYASS